jgi:hypothetical protein
MSGHFLLVSISLQLGKQEFLKVVCNEKRGGGGVGKDTYVCYTFRTIVIKVC